MSHENSEPAGLCGLRKQVIEAKEGSLEFRRKKTHVCVLRKAGEREAIGIFFFF